MARVEASEVESILVDILTSTDSIDPFIAAATALIDQVDLEGKGLSADLAKEVERWLSAHFYKIMDMARSKEGVTEAQIAYQYKLGLNLQVTMYGQQVLVLDSTGEMKKLNDAKAKTTFTFEHMSNEDYES